MTNKYITFIRTNKHVVVTTATLLIIIGLFFVQREANQALQAQIKAQQDTTNFILKSLVTVQFLVSPDNGQTLQLNPNLTQPAP